MHLAARGVGVVWDTSWQDLGSPQPKESGEELAHSSDTELQPAELPWNEGAPLGKDCTFQDPSARSHSCPETRTLELDNTSLFPPSQHAQILATTQEPARHSRTKQIGKKKLLLVATSYLPLALYLSSSCLEISSYYFTTKNAHYISHLSCMPNIYLATTYPDSLRYLSRTDVLAQANLEDILFCLHSFDCTVKILDKSPLANI